MEPTHTYLFTYGTLMSGFTNPFSEKLHNSAVLVGKGNFPGILYQISWYPGAVYKPFSDLKVYGEIYQLSTPEVILAELDAYEDVFEDEKESLYLRKTIAVASDNNRIIDCWVYLYNQPVTGLAVIQDGYFKG